MTALSQRDARWANDLLGSSSTSTIGKYGCLITCLAMVAGTTPNVINDRLQAVQGFTGDLVIWSKVKEVIPFDFSYTIPYDNDSVKKEIDANGFCLVRVDFDGKISSPSDTHFVLYTGNQQMIDPWTGVTKSTSYYPLTTGYCPCKKITAAPQPAPDISDDAKRALDYIAANKGQDSNLEGAVRGWFGCYMSKPELESKAKQLDGLIETLKAEWNLPTTASTADVIAEAAKLPRLEDVAQEYRDSIEGCVGTFPSDSSLLEAHKAVRKQIDLLAKERDDLVQKLAEAKQPTGYKFLKSWTIASLLFRLYRKDVNK